MNRRLSESITGWALPWGMALRESAGWVGQGLQVRVGCTGVYVRDAADPGRRLTFQSWKWQSFVSAVKRGEISP